MGKTAVVQRFIAGLNPAADMSLGLNFSSQTSSLQLQRALEVEAFSNLVLHIFDQRAC